LFALKFIERYNKTIKLFFKNMKYYSNKIFYFFIAIYILAALGMFLYWRVGSVFTCWTLSGIECTYAKIKFNVFGGIIPLLFIIMSGLIIVSQQRGYKKLGYFMVPLLVIPFLYIGYLSWYATGSNIKNLFFIPGPPEDIFFWFETLILIIITIIPFYVLGRLIKEDLFKR
jgi:hypothetical protein